MSESEEQRFIEAIKRLIRPDQIVVISSSRQEISRYANQVLLFEKGIGIRSIDVGKSQRSTKTS